MSSNVAESGKCRGGELLISKHERVRCALESCRLSSLKMDLVEGFFFNNSIAWVMVSSCSSDVTTATKGTAPTGVLVDRRNTDELCLQSIHTRTRLFSYFYR